MQPFASSYEHLLAELERIDLLIRARVGHLRKLQSEDEHFRGLYISEREVDSLLAQPNGRPAWLQAGNDGWLKQVDAALRERSIVLEQRCMDTRAQNTPLRLERLQQAFALSRFEVDVVLVCVAGELDLRYERLYAYLQDDVTRKRPSVELAIQLVGGSESQRLAARNSFGAASPLLTHQLLHLLDDAAQPNPPLLGKYLKVDERIVHYLLDGDTIDERLHGASTLADTTIGLDDLRLDDDAKRAIRQAWPELLPDIAPVLVLRGPVGAGKRSIAAALCHERRWPLLMIDAAALFSGIPETATQRGSAAQEWRDRVGLIRREAMLRDAVLYWYGMNAWTGEGERAQLAAVQRAIDESRVRCLVGTTDTLDVTSAFPGRGGVVIALPEPTHSQRQAHWTTRLANISMGDDVDLGGVAARFKLSLGQIQSAAANAANLARLRGGAEAPLAQRDLLEACRLQSNQKLGSLARKIPPHNRWEDIVLPPDRIAQLREICNQVKYRERVYGDWGFGRKLALGKGLAVLFSGPSGTGKTMSAGIIAGELGLDLYKIDLSTVVSKYIGETEKNLSRIFDEAETSNAILFFDEADALFGKRSEVRDSHDRYANIEVGFLLQRMEEYEGVAILATNFRKNMDDAFVRRLHFTLEFPYPDAEHRHRIWEGIWPTDTPRAAGLDLQMLAERYEMTGGNIKNVALAAAFLAADDGHEVRLSHVVRAIQREYQKSGKLMMEDDEIAFASEVRVR